MIVCLCRLWSPGIMMLCVKGLGFIYHSRLRVQFRSWQSVATEAWPACFNVYVCWKVPWFFFFSKTLSYWRVTEMLPMAELPLRWSMEGQFRETEEAALGCQSSSGIWLPQTDPCWDKCSRIIATIVPISQVQKAQALNILIFTAYAKLSSLKYSSMCPKSA